MKENTEKAKKYFSELLKKKKLTKNNYDCDFSLFMFGEEEKVKHIKISFFIDNFELSPFILISTEKGGFGIMNKDFILDKYDKMSIRDSFEKLENDCFYDVKLLPKIIKTMKLA